MYDAVPVYYDDTDSSISVSSYGAFSISGVGGIIIRGSETPYDNWDQWDTAIVLHEYGHAFMDQNAEFPPVTGGTDHWYWFPPPNEPLKVAYVEAWAYFFAGVAQNSKILVDRKNDMSIGWVINLEQPYPDVPFATAMNPSSPPLPNPLWEGAHVDGAIAEALWDVYDLVDDGLYYLDDTLWGHNNDSNAYTSWNEMGAIMDVFWDFDPQPDNPDHDYCWNIYEFIHGWRKKGYPVDARFKNIFEAHAVPVFMPGNVDNDLGDNVNVADVTYLVDYLFRGGPPPAHPSAADVDASCVVNVAGLTYLLDYLFRGGPECLVGCVDLYP